MRIRPPEPSNSSPKTTGRTTGPAMKSAADAGSITTPTLRTARSTSGGMSLPARTDAVRLGKATRWTTIAMVMARAKVTLKATAYCPRRSPPTAMATARVSALTKASVAAAKARVDVW